MVVFGGLVLISLVPPFGLSGQQAQTLAAVLGLVVLWSTGAIPAYLASILFFSVVVIFGIATPEVVFAGFSSAAVWLVVSGFVIGSAVSSTGLAALVAARVGPWLARSYLGLVAGLILVCTVIAFFMPSSVGRAVVMVPIGMALADRCGLGRGSKGRTGVAVALAIGCNMPGLTILPSNIPNMVLAGSSETLWGIQLGYAGYLMLHFPIMGLAKMALAVLLIIWLFPAKLLHGASGAGVQATLADGGAPAEASATGTAAGPAGATSLRARRFVSVVLAGTLIMWMLDSVHGINPAWVGMVSASILLWPRLGVVGPEAFRRAIDFGPILFVVGALAMGSLVNQSGLGGIIAGAFERTLPLAPGQDSLNFFSLVTMALGFSLLATSAGVPALMTPMAGDLAQLTGWDLRTVLMSQVVGYSTILFPFQVPPLIVAMQLAGERLEQVMRVILPLGLLTLVLLVPLDLVWWQILGWL